MSEKAEISIRDFLQMKKDLEFEIAKKLTEMIDSAKQQLLEKAGVHVHNVDIKMETATLRSRLPSLHSYTHRPGYGGGGGEVSRETFILGVNVKLHTSLGPENLP